MNREIKFRAWDKACNRMILPEKSSEFKITFLGSVLEFETYANECVLMQYTGLKDKNGNEIYEGDIFSHKYQTGRYVQDYELSDRRNEIPKVIPGMSMNFTWTSFGESEDVDEVKIPEFYSYLHSARENLCYENIQEVCDYLEIIGNIFENPELIEAKDDR